MVRELLIKNGLQISDVGYWVIHPGGDRIIEALKTELGLPENQLVVTRSVLSEYGNMSSPTVIFELDRILEKGIAQGEWCVMIAFGAGFSAHAYLLRG